MHRVLGETIMADAFLLLLLSSMCLGTENRGKSTETPFADESMHQAPEIRGTTLNGFGPRLTNIELGCLRNTGPGSSMPSRNTIYPIPHSFMDV